MARGKLVGLANVHDRPGVCSNRVFKVGETDDFRVRTGAKTRKHVPGHHTSRFPGIYRRRDFRPTLVI